MNNNSVQLIKKGKLSSIKNICDAYSSCNGKFGCNIVELKLNKKSIIRDKWCAYITYTFKDMESKKKFDIEVDMTYDSLIRNNHAISCLLK